MIEVRDVDHSMKDIACGGQFRVFGSATGCPLMNGERRPYRIQIKAGHFPHVFLAMLYSTLMKKGCSGTDSIWIDF